jgi:hypothetical protein
MWFLGRRRRRALGVCVFCSRDLNPKDQVAAMREDVVRKFYGRVPTELKPYVDPVGHQRWFAHLTCLHSAALKAGGELDTTCVVCGKEVDAEEREPPDGRVRKLLGVEPTKAGRKPDLANIVLASLDAATHAWQCQQCARWQCNRCVCAALVNGGVSDHDGCGGRFAPPS